MAKVNARYWGLSDLLVYSQIYLTLLAGMFFTLKGWISVGDLVVFSSYSVFILWPARQLGRLIADMGRVSVALDRIFEILDEEVEDLHTGLVPEIQGHIQFNDVSFSYEEGGPRILDKVSFEVKPGEKVAIMGPTGSGKSSLVVLLARLYDSYQGQILVDGVDIQTMQKDYLRKRLGIVLQEPFLYSRSLFENIKLANPEAKMDQVREAAQVAQIDSVIQSFDQGYDTLVGEKGVTLSGGQKQRVAIARVVINQPPILIFDDSLSAVDSQTDYDIRHALANHVSGQTLLLITSRTNTAMGMDKILVMDQGKIVQVGTHDELSSQPGLYQELYQLQHRMDQGGLLNG